MTKAGTSLRTYPVHLGRGAVAVPQPTFDGAMAWYEAYGERNADDGREGRLVALHDFTGDWTSWEMHPEGDELVVCTAGAIAVIQQRPDGTEEALRLEPGDYAINPVGTWHTADVDESATALFVTPGLGTQHRPR